jgi:hypothetical protein
MTSSSSGDRVAAKVDDEEEEAEALVERYALGGACT